MKNPSLHIFPDFHYISPLASFRPWGMRYEDNYYCKAEGQHHQTQIHSPFFILKVLTKPRACHADL